jgi:hypothetical protein
MCEPEDVPPLSASVSLQLLLPPLEARSHGLHLKAAGRVVRTGNAREETGFALASDFGAAQRHRRQQQQQ